MYDKRDVNGSKDSTIAPGYVHIAFNFQYNMVVKSVAEPDGVINM